VPGRPRTFSLRRQQSEPAVRPARCQLPIGRWRWLRRRFGGSRSEAEQLIAPYAVQPHRVRIIRGCDRQFRCRCGGRLVCIIGGEGLEDRRRQSGLCQGVQWAGCAGRGTGQRRRCLSRRLGRSSVIDRGGRSRGWLLGWLRGVASAGRSGRRQLSGIGRPWDLPGVDRQLPVCDRADDCQRQRRSRDVAHNSEPSRGVSPVFDWRGNRRVQDDIGRRQDGHGGSVRCERRRFIDRRCRFLSVPMVCDGGPVARHVPGARHGQGGCQQGSEPTDASICVADQRFTRSVVEPRLR